MNKKKKTGYWKARFSVFRRSFSENSISRWAGIFAVDGVFILGFAVLLVFMIVLSAEHIRSADVMAEELMPTMALIQSGNMKDMRESIDQVNEKLERIMTRIVGSMILNYILFAVFVSCWGYVGFSKALKKKVSWAGFSRFIAAGVLWLLAGMIIIVLPLAFVFKSLASIVISLVLLFVFIYMTILFFSIIVLYGIKDGLKKIADLRFKGIHKIGFAFIFCVLVLLVIDLLYFFELMPFGIIGFIFSFLIVVLYVSWSRQYICLEIKRVVDEN